MSYIEREAAVNALAKIINNSDMPEDWNKGMSAAMSALHRVPAADVREVKWISVEERLPENCDDRFLVCTRGMTGGLWQSICYYANNLHEVDEYDFPNDNRPGFYFYDSEYGWIEKEDVTHWMPLPEPPKEET